jgi:tetratricopeptide (TPR) repeat protein
VANRAAGAPSSGSRSAPRPAATNRLETNLEEHSSALTFAGRARTIRDMSIGTGRRRVIVDDRALAAAIGSRLKRARLGAGLTQQQLAGERYTKAYVSALENGLAKPSMAALAYLTERLGTTPSALLSDPAQTWSRLEADLHLAAGDWRAALDDYLGLLSRTTDRGTRAELLIGAAEALCRLERPADAIEPASEAAATFEHLGRQDDRARAEYWLARARHEVDNPIEARAILRSLIDRIRAGLVVDPDFRARILIALALVDASHGETSSALGSLEEARALVGELDDRRRAAFLTSLAIGYRQSGNLEAAIRVGLQALALLRSAQAELDAIHLGNQLALAYLAAGKVGRAQELAEEARHAAASRGDDRAGAQVTDTQAKLALASGDPEAALALSEESERLAGAAGNDRALLDALVTRGQALTMLGRHEESAAALERASELAHDRATPARRRKILSARADALAALGRHDQAYALMREALATR